MSARELHDDLAPHGAASWTIIGDEDRATILRALALAAAVEEAQDELVRELRGFVDHLHERGHDEDAQLVDDARALLVARSQEIERFKELDRLAEALANWVRALSNNVNTRKLLADYEAYRAAKGTP